jgi:hypothetical protein
MQISRRYQRYDNISTDIIFEITFMMRAIARIARSRPMKSLRIPVVFPIIYSKLDIERV